MPYCEMCDDDIDDRETLCEDCKERRVEEWREHQDWLRSGGRTPWEEYRDGC
jgi:hypothetical protein